MAYEDVTKKYKKEHPKSIATGVYDVTRSKALEKGKRENPYDKAFRAGKIPPHLKPSKEMKRFIDGK